MKAVLLAAGLGTRLRPLTDTVPKCLAPILGTPLLGIWLDRLLGSRIVERVLVNTHYLPQQVTNFVRDSRWSNEVDLVFEPELLGTGGTLLENRQWIGQDAILVAHADNLTLFDTDAFLAAHRNRPSGCALTMMTFDTDAPHSCGIVEEDAGVVVRFHEKVPNPPGCRANAAVYIFEPEVIAFMASFGTRFVDISTQVLPHFLGRMATYHNSVYHRDIGTLNSLALAQQELAGCHHLLLGRNEDREL